MIRLRGAHSVGGSRRRERELFRSNCGTTSRPRERVGVRVASVRDTYSRPTKISTPILVALGSPVDMTAIAANFITDVFGAAPM